MRFEGHKPLVHGGVAGLARNGEVVRVERGFRIRGRQRVVAGVAVGAARDALRFADGQDFAVVGLVVGIGNGGGQVVALGDAGVGMAGLAARREGLFLQRQLLAGNALRGGDAVQAVAVGAGRGIGVPGRDGPAVPHEGIVPRIMAADALFLDGHFRGLIRLRERVNFLMAVRAGHVLRHGMCVGPERPGNLAVAARAADRIGFLFPGTVPGDVANSGMAAGTGVVAVNGCGKAAGKSRIGMTGLTGAPRALPPALSRDHCQADGKK